MGQVIYLTRREPTAAEAHVIRLAERADMAERAKMMVALAGAVATLKEVVQLTKERDGRNG